MKNKIKWKHLKFVPEAAVPDTKGICFGDQGFLYLCNELNEGRSPFGYTIRDTKFRPGEGGSNVSFDFTGLREALWKDQYKNPRKPSIFVRYSTAIGYERLVEARRRMLWAAIREYDTPGELAMDKECDYCGTIKHEPFAAPLNTLTGYMADCICRSYTDPADELPWDGEDDKYVGEVFDAGELLEHLGFEVKDGDLWGDVVRAFSGRNWCRKDAMAMTPLARHRYGWDRFKQAVKHERRYTFWSIKIDRDSEEYHPDYMPVGNMLAEIGEMIRDAGVIKKLPSPTNFWRVRVHDTAKPLTLDADLSPPPLKFATKPNRMSPPGIVMFYGAEDFETACVETVGSDVKPDEVVTGAMFRSERDLTVLDLATLPLPPSFFAETASDYRHALRFLHGFSHDISRPIVNDGVEHIEYVPTQAFTEYVRFMLNPDSTIDGIRYRSSKNGRACIVLFCGRDHCVADPEDEDAERWLSFDKTTLRTTNATSTLSLSSATCGPSFGPR